MLSVRPAFRICDYSLMRCLRSVLLPWLFAALSTGSVAAEVIYKVEITGIDDEQVEHDVEATSQLVKLQDRPPPSNAALRRRADDDLPRLKQVIEAAGYRAAAVDYDIDVAAQPVAVTVKVTSGPLYRLDAVTLLAPEGGAPPGIDAADPKAFGLELGGPASSAPVLAAEPKIVDAFAQRGRPFAKVVNRRVVVDHGTQAMSVTYTVEAGAPAKFGALQIDGLKSVDRGFIERRIEWERGGPFDSREVE